MIFAAIEGSLNKGDEEEDVAQKNKWKNWELEKLTKEKPEKLVNQWESEDATSF